MERKPPIFEKGGKQPKLVGLKKKSQLRWLLTSWGQTTIHTINSSCQTCKL